MVQKTLFILFIFIISFTTTCAYANNKTHINIAPAEKWVEKQAFEVPDTLPITEISGGSHYLLVDEQVLVNETLLPAYYQHYSNLITNTTGLEEHSQISISFDPIYQTLTWHTLEVVRNGIAISQLSKEKIEIMQRETEMEKLIYNGRLTANVILDDVRVGDVINYSFTIKGSNPIYKGLFAYQIYTQWHSPVHEQFFQLNWGKKKPLYIQKINNNHDIEQYSQGGNTIYRFENKHIAGQKSNSETPNWHLPYQEVIFSELDQWEHIANWAWPLYKEALSESDAVKQIAHNIEQKSDNHANQIMLALQYTQGEIRYLGLEMGENSHKPSHAHQTVKRRYGDCKDKAVLLIALLKELEIEAHPALVNTEIGKAVGGLISNIHAFDHVIVLVKHDGKNYWLDPTKSVQQGPLNQITQGDHGYALVLDGQSKTLTKMNEPNQQTNSLVVNDTFNLVKGAGNEVIFRSESRYSGKRGEHQRNRIAAHGLQEIQRNFIDFYKIYYPDISTIQKTYITSAAHQNQIVYAEKYKIDNFWEKSDDGEKYYATFYANAVIPEIQRPKELKRTAPYALKYPQMLQQTINIKLPPSDWDFDVEKFEEKNDFFHFTFNEHFDKNKNQLIVTYKYQTLMDHVHPNRLNEYLEAREKVKDYETYQIFDYAEPVIETASEEPFYDEWTIMLLIIESYVLALLYGLLNWWLESRKTSMEERLIFFPVSLIKLCFFSIATFGGYSVYWFYRNWQHIKKENNSSIMPIARAIFSPFWYYPLYKKLAAYSQQHNDQDFISRPLAIFYAFTYLVFSILATSILPLVPLVATLLLPLMLCPLANYINHIPQKNKLAYQNHSRWRFRHIFILVTFIPCATWELAGGVNLMPSGDVIKGKQLWSHDIAFMENNQVIESGEEVLYFYSDAVFNMKNDGNGFSHSHVFSYWMDKNKSVHIFRSALNEVKNIRIERGDLLNNTTIYITKDNGKEFFLYIPGQGIKAKEFEKNLKKHWKIAKQKDR